MSSLRIKKSEFFKNLNSEYDVPISTQKALMNGNAQFIMELAKEMSTNSYSLPSLAIQLCHYFFYRKSYFNYDRFIIACGCFLLASKIKDNDIKIKKLCFAYTNIASRIYESNEKINDEPKLKALKEQICIAESQILKVIDFEFEFKLPYDYLDALVKKYFNRENIFYMTKVIILDSFRTHCCLVFHPLIVALTSLIIVCNLLNEEFIPNEFFSKINFFEADNLIVRKNESEIEKLKNEAYVKWLESVRDECGIEVDPKEIIECINIINDLLKTYGANSAEEKSQIKSEIKAEFVDVKEEIHPEEK